jgi:hypothetical protein
LYNHQHFNYSPTIVYHCIHVNLPAGAFFSRFWGPLPSLPSTFKIFRLWKKSSTIKLGHLGYAIGTKITNLVEDHPVIISIMLQFHWLSSFWQEDFRRFNQSEHIIGPFITFIFEVQFVCIFFYWNHLKKFLFSSPGPKGQVSFCHHFASVVVVPVI